MQEDFLWAIVGMAMVIVELLTGTFYLLMLAVAAFGAALAAWLGQPLGVQAVVAAVVSGAGCYGVHLYHAKNTKGQMKPLDAGQPASFEGWVDRAAGRARVLYRGAPWEATVEGEPEPGATVYVVATHGNTLEVSTRRPA